MIYKCFHLFCSDENKDYGSYSYMIKSIFLLTNLTGGDFMDNNKIIIVALIAVIVILIIGLTVAIPNFGKGKTNITIKSNDTISQGDSIKVKLTDVNGTPIDNGTVNVTIKNEKTTVVKKAVLTDKDGTAKIKMDADPGNYTVNCTFNGDDNFTQNTTTKHVEVKEPDDVEVDTGSSDDTDDPGAFYSEQEGRVIYTGEIHDAPDGHRYMHLGYNEWEMVD